MKNFAISDLHLTGGADKPMDIFGESWVGHWEKIQSDWREKVSSEDTVMIAGDISWSMTLDSVRTDLDEIEKLPGTKIIIRGNHDYWWASRAKLDSLGYKTIYFIQNDAIKAGDTVFCGTRGWSVPENNETQSAEDKKIFTREIIRLEMSLKAAAKIADEGDEIIGMLHFPPFNSAFDASPFTDLFDSFGVKKIIYGHLHGAFGRYKDVVDVHGAEYYLTSCDFLKNSLIRL
jgi:predicted phosphohydrolase